MAQPSAPFRIWRGSRGNRLPPGAYRADHPVHVIVATGTERPPFHDPGLARAVFDLLENDPSTLAACLMPDHLHWLLVPDGGVGLVSRVSRFKSVSTRIAWARGLLGRLWQRSFWDRVVRSDESLREAALYLVANPVRAGVVERVGEYPFQVVFPERFPW